MTGDEDRILVLPSNKYLLLHGHRDSYFAFNGRCQLVLGREALFKGKELRRTGSAQRLTAHLIHYWQLLAGIRRRQIS